MNLFAFSCCDNQFAVSSQSNLIFGAGTKVSLTGSGTQNTHLPALQ